MSLLDRFCNWLSSKLEKRVICREDGEPYLERYYILHSSRFKFLPGIYLHKFLSSDNDLELHNHPWNTSLSLILSGRYLEERRDMLFNGNYQVSHYVFAPGCFNLIRKNDFHRIDLLDRHVWTLFFSGDRQQDWGFWDRETGEFTPWREFVAHHKST